MRMRKWTKRSAFLLEVDVCSLQRDGGGRGPQLYTQGQPADRGLVRPSVACLILLAPLKEAINSINTRHHASSILYVTCEYKHARSDRPTATPELALRVTLAEAVSF